MASVTAISENPIMGQRAVELPTIQRTMPNASMRVQSGCALNGAAVSGAVA